MKYKVVLKLYKSVICIQNDTLKKKKGFICDTLPSCGLSLNIACTLPLHGRSAEMNMKTNAIREVWLGDSLNVTVRQ